MDEKRALVDNDLALNHDVAASCDQHTQLMPPVLPAVQQPIVLQVTTPRKLPKIKTDYKSELSRRFGIAQLVLGSAAIILNIVGIVIHATSQRGYEDEDNPGYYHYPRDNHMYYIGAGLWCPILFFSLSGAFSIGAAHRKTSCMIIANMVLCIVSSIFAIVMLVFACVALGLDINAIKRGFEYEKGYAYYYDLDDDSWPYKNVPNFCSVAAAKAKASMAVTTLWVLVSVAEFIVCVWTATLCCRVLSCAVGTNNNAEPAMSARYTVNGDGSVQPQLLVLDSQGRPIPGAQVIQIPGPSGIQQIQTCQGSQPQATAVQGDLHVKQGPDPVLPPPYQA